MVLVETSPILVEYQTYMRGCNVVDQLVGQYSVQVKSHKWWDGLFMVTICDYYQHVEDTSRDMYGQRLGLGKRIGEWMGV